VPGVIKKASLREPFNKHHPVQSLFNQLTTRQPIFSLHRQRAGRGLFGILYFEQLNLLKMSGLEFRISVFCLLFSMTGDQPQRPPQCPHLQYDVRYELAMAQANLWAAAEPGPALCLWS